MAKFFIDRPIFAWVIALFIMVMGAVSITQLPIAQYPPVAPPSIVISRPIPARRPGPWKTACCRSSNRK
jgi:multidrug efflux pump